jgi:N-acetylglutamate synthase-like GNAT family acetyltransferase
MLGLRKALESDVPFLVQLRHETMYTHLQNSGVELDSDAQLARVMYQFDCAQIILIDRRAVGLLKVNRNSNPWNLIQIQLSPMVQGQGLGESLVACVLEEARNAGVNVELSVLKANPAKRLYERLGFRVVDETELEYSMLFAI